MKNFEIPEKTAYTKQIIRLQTKNNEYPRRVSYTNSEFSERVT